MSPSASKGAPAEPTDMPPGNSNDQAKTDPNYLKLDTIRKPPGLSSTPRAGRSRITVK